ncbi:MAG: DMT family transporter [Actinomycetes bacterium]|jgi:DME family drug/metabolite transporter|nr:MAG: EamA family transporter [Actinomycetota bacterium]
MKTNNPAGRGFLFVVLGAALWGTDSLFRYWLAFQMPAPRLVFLEHLVLVLITLPFILRGREALRSFTRSDWVSAAVIGIGPSALATILFTKAFTYGDPTTPVLLQKIQPLVAVIGATLLLKEKILPRFGFFLAAAVTGAYLVAFKDPTAVSISALVPALLAVGAASLWGLGTVLGRRLAPKVPFETMTGLRFLFGLPAAGVIMTVLGEAASPFALTSREALGVLLLALFPGLFALMVYYRGLQATPASAATIGELAYPVTATAINYFVYDTVLSPTQWVGAALLVGTISVMNFLARSRDFSQVGVVAQQPAEA